MNAASGAPEPASSSKPLVCEVCKAPAIRHWDIRFLQSGTRVDVWVHGHVRIGGLRGFCELGDHCVRTIDGELKA